MHTEGPGAWFGSGENERALILKMGGSWNAQDSTILEIGCGEGELLGLMWCRCPFVEGIDYSETAISKLRNMFPHLTAITQNYRDHDKKHSRLVLQGVLEHLDDPFAELQWMMDNLLIPHGDVITSSPGFINPRGFTWMALDMLGAVMSKTDLHFLNPWDFDWYAKQHGYGLSMASCDNSWAAGPEMVADLTKRIPLALKDGKIPYDERKLSNFLAWLERAGAIAPLASVDGGATIVYRITK